jgi:hypothetical protein
MKTYIYTPDLSKVTVHKTQEEQDLILWCSGHPDFLIPDFNPKLEDIWTSFMTWYEREMLNGDQIFDQNGGEVRNSAIIDPTTGLTKCIYVAEMQPLDTGKEYDFREFKVHVEGYVVDDGDQAYFAATKVDIEE